MTYAKKFLLSFYYHFKQLHQPW